MPLTHAVLCSFCPSVLSCGKNFSVCSNILAMKVITSVYSLLLYTTILYTVFMYSSLLLVFQSLKSVKVQTMHMI